jgi:hypothetical protein
MHNQQQHRDFDHRQHRVLRYQRRSLPEERGDAEWAAPRHQRSEAEGRSRQDERQGSQVFNERASL